MGEAPAGLYRTSFLSQESLAVIAPPITLTLQFVMYNVIARVLYSRKYRVDAGRFAHRRPGRTTYFPTCGWRVVRARSQGSCALRDLDRFHAIEVSGSDGDSV